MNQDNLVDFTQFNLEKHVENTLKTIARRTLGEQVNALNILEAVTLVAKKSDSKAYQKLVELVPITEFPQTKPITKMEPLINQMRFNPELHTSFQIAQAIWKEEDGAVWGRDFITMALLTKDDPSLDELAKQTGIDLNEVRDKWFLFVQSESQPHPPELWARWWETAGFPLPEIENNESKTYLLFWNPDNYKTELFQKIVTRFNKGRDSNAGWSSGNRKDVNIGEKVYLYRQGSENQGLIGSGTISGEVSVQPHFDESRRASGDTYNRMPINWDILQVEPLIPREELESITEEKDIWHSRSGGIQIPNKVLELLDATWQKILRKRFIKLKIRAVSDKTSSSQEDILGYRNYSTAISQIIIENADKEPFNIGIIAPWGHGKTTLMEFIREDLEPEYRKKENQESTNQFMTTFSELKLWLSGESEGLFSFNKVSKYHPTVWFNAWKYQSSDQIWAGIGHAIISQLVEKLDPLEQEKFWFRLKSSQYEKHTLQKSIYRYIYQNLPLTIASLVLLILMFAGSFVLFDKGMEWPGLTSLLAGGGSGFWGFKNFKAIQTRLKSKIHGSFAETVKTPDYSENLGLFHQLTEDLQHIFDTLIDPKKPAIIFIDDLDRCSPDVVADVMEAINLIMTNPLIGNHCYFIFGMDAQVVAATLDDKYSTLKGKLPGREHTYGSVGWYFLDKFIQLPFIIPIMQNEEKKKFLGKFFVSAEEEDDDPGTKEKLEATKKDLVEAINNKDDNKISNIIKTETNTQAKRQLEKEYIAERIKSYQDDSEEIVEQLDYLSDYLSSSPREIKRYVNLLTLHNVHQNLRFHNSQLIPTNKEIAKWLLISLKWPQLVRWIQWENEQELVSLNTPEEKAKKLDDLIHNFIKQQPQIAQIDKELLTAWKDYLKAQNINSKQWLKDKQLFQVLISEHGKDGGLEKAINCRVW